MEWGDEGDWQEMKRHLGKVCLEGFLLVSSP